MSDVDLSEFMPEAKPARCKVRTILDNLEEEAMLKCAAALMEPSIPHARISQVLTSWGHTVGETVVRRHRRGECSCG